MTKRRVVITGMGVLSPLGGTLADSWKAACAGESGIGPVTRFDASAFPTRIAGEVTGFDPDAFIPKKELKKLDLFSQYALVAGAEAWESAKLEPGKFEASRAGSILGIGMGGLTTLEKYYSAYLNGGPRKISPFLIPAMISNLGPGNLAMKYGLKGINFTITSACTSATHAIGESMRMIAGGSHDVILTGGTESTVSPIGIGGFCAMKALSTRNEEPTKASRPFDRDRDGFVLGEGSAILVLEELEHAEKRGANILAEVIGYGASCDAYHLTAPSPEGEGAVQCMREALNSSGLNAEDIAYINAHGTSTGANDKTETAAIKQVFSSWAKEGLVVSSTKSVTGHLLGAAGAIEAAFCVQAILNSTVPPTVNLDNPDENCDLDYVPHKAREMTVKAAMSNSFGFGGTNGSVVIGSFRG